MIKQAYELAQVKKPLIAATLIHYKQANKGTMDMEPMIGGAEPGMMDKAMAMGSDALEAGKRYGPGVGIGAGAGALAGLPVSLLANAVFGKDKSLRGYLRSALMGSLIGGGLGGLGAGGLQYYGESSPERGAKVDAGIDYLGGLFNKGIGALGLGQGVQNLPGFNRPAPAGGEGAI
jgi:hypothetical protein